MGGLIGTSPAWQDFDANSMMGLWFFYACGITILSVPMVFGDSLSKTIHKAGSPDKKVAH